MSLLVANYGSDSDSEHEEDQKTLNKLPSNNKSSASQLGQLLPPPKNNNNNKKSTESSNKKTIFTIPTIEKDEEEEDRPIKRLKMGTTSTDLADLLPAPKHSYNPFQNKQSSNQSTLTSRIEKHTTNSSNKVISKNSRVEEKKDIIEEEEEQEDEVEEEINQPKTISHTGSFFRIGSSLKEEPVIKLPKKPIHIPSPSKTTTTTMHKSTDESINNSNSDNNQPTNTPMQLPEIEDPNAMYAFGADPNAYYQYYYQEQSHSETSSTNQEVLDSDALSQLGGKRRGENAGVNIVNINQQDILPSDEWRRHATAAQPKTMASSGSMEANTLQKKKNNIMALAAQARSMEHSLEERYAKERVVKNEARRRYGF